MKVAFKTGLLKFEQLGPDNWRIIEPFVAQVECDEWHEPVIVCVPGGYTTDFESVPKALWWAYMMIKGKARKAATLHDYLLDHIDGDLHADLTTNLLPFKPGRVWIDRLFYDAMVAQGTGLLARETAYMGVSAYTAFVKWSE